ncbi:MAG: hypothetical protein CMK59_00065 [Proteobacteria bacterium]|nr:hypothetical protein [Pseudomonadota bacterium]
MWFLFFISGCYEVKTEIEVLAERCMPLLIQIDQKQQLRNEKMDQQQQLSEQRKNKLIGEQEFKEHFSLWMNEEQQLREEVNSLMNKAEREGCL